MTNVTLTWIGSFIQPTEEVNSSAEHARKTLRDKGWAWRRAAERLGYSYSHFSKVLSGIHQSDTLLDSVATLPPSPIPYRNSGFARKGAK